MENIKKSYAAMEAKGPEALAKFEKAIAESGNTDVLAGIKRERMRDKVLEMQVGSAEDAQAVKKLVNSYYGATTPQGKEEALNQLRENGYGEQAVKIERAESEFAMQETAAKFEMEQSLYDQAKLKIDQSPVYTDQKAHDAWLKTVPPQVQDYANLRRAKYVATMAEYTEKATPEKIGSLTDSIIEKAGFTKEEYASLRAGLGPLEANKKVYDAYSKKTASEVAKKDSPVAAAAVSNAAKYIEEYMKDADDSEMYEGYERRLAQRTAEIADKEGITNLATAFDMAKTELATEIAKEEAPKPAGRPGRNRRDRAKEAGIDARSTGEQRAQTLQDISDEDLDAAIARLSGARQ
jgi:hypothetical protein